MFLANDRLIPHTSVLKLNEESATVKVATLGQVSAHAGMGG